MSQVNKRLRNLVLFYVFFPAFLLLAWINFVYYRDTQEQSQAVLESVLDTISSSVEFEFKTVGAQAQTLATTPQTFGLLLLKSPGLKNYSENRASPASALVRDEATLTTEFYARFRDLQSAHPELISVVLIDNLGQSMASLNATVSDNYSREEWHKRLLLENSDLPTFIGMTPDSSLKADTFKVAVAVQDRSRTNPTTVGCVLIDVDLGKIMERIKNLGIPENHAGAVLVPFKWHLLAAENVGASNAEATLGYLRQKRITPPQGNWNGLTFRTRTLSNAFEMAVPPRFVALYQGSVLSTSGGLRVVTVVAASVIALILLTALAQARVQRINRETQELTDAGSWLLHQMRGEDNMPASRLTSLVRSPMYDEILRWQSGYKQSIADDIETYAFENKRDLFLARDFQMAYMARPYPPIPTMPLPGRLRLKFSHRYKPALAVGGDFFEILSLTPETGAVFIADVMGHGTRSGLITSILRVIIADTRAQGGNARNFLREMNRKFHDILSTIDMEIPLFASAYYFVADCTARAATYSTAGHPAPFHLRRHANLLETLKVSEPHGAALGISPDEDYTGGSCRLSGGDVFIFFTDGVYECFNPRGEEYGIANLEKTIRRLMHRNADEILQGIVDSLEDYSGGTILHDDICILAVEVEEDLSTIPYVPKT